MDGKTLSRDMAKLILEDPDTSGFLDDRSTYMWLWKSAIEMSRRLLYPRAEQSITTVADQRDQYKLNADFLQLYLRDSDDEFFLRYYNGSAYSNIKMKDEQAIFENYATASVATPGGWCITDYRVAISNVTGTATSDGNKSAGQSTLTDSAASFSSTVSGGDTIHNTTDSSTGIVLSVTSATAIVVAMFGGTDNEWDTSDDYVIVPQKRYQVAFDAAPSTAGHTVTAPYVARPNPVFSDYGIYPFPLDMTFALVNYSAFLYKYRDSQPDFGNRWFALFDRDVRRSATQLTSALTRKRLRVSFKV